MVKSNDNAFVCKFGLGYLFIVIKSGCHYPANQTHPIASQKDIYIGQT